MNKLKKGALVVTSVVILNLLSGCAALNGNATLTKEQPAEEVTIVKPANQIYAPGKHFIYKRYNNLKSDWIFNKNAAGQVEIPDGYEIFDVENVNRTIDGVTKTGGFDVFFINAEEVEAEAVLDEETGAYVYSQPGVPTREKEPANQR